MAAVYSTLVMLACKTPHQMRVNLRGNEKALDVSALGGDEWLEVALGNNGTVGTRMSIRSNGTHPIPSGYSWCEVTKSGQGSPTTVELVHNV